MKKIYIFLSLFTVVFVLSACKEKIIDIPIEMQQENEENDPVDNENTPETPDDKTEDPCDPVIIEVEVPVPVEIERQRKYKPGTYFNSSENSVGTNGYNFVVVVVDGYGDISGVLIDETYSSKRIYADSDGKLYVYVVGNGTTVPNSYRLIDKDLDYNSYPTGMDALTTDDYIVGIHSDEINELAEIQVNETKAYLENQLDMEGKYTYQKQVKMISEKIITDNTTYGFNLYESGNSIKTDSIAGVSIHVLEYLELVQEILDNDARISESDYLLSKDDPIYGIYEPGSYVSYSDKLFVDDSLNFDFSFVVVDDFGVISGVYLDSTSSDTITEGSNSSKGIMKEAYGLGIMAETSPWYAQANALSQQIINNQGIKGIELLRIDPLNGFDDSSIDILETEGRLPLYTDSVASVSVRVDGMLQAVDKTLNSIKYSNYVDGTYYKTNSGENHIFNLLTIKDGEIKSIYIDKVKSVYQAQHSKSDNEYKVFKFIRLFKVNDVTLSASIRVYQDGDDYYSIDDFHYIGSLELDDREKINKDELMNLDTVESDTLVAVPGYYTARIAKDSDYVNLNGWSNYINLITTKFLESNGTDSLLVDEQGLTLYDDMAVFNTTDIVNLVNKTLYSARNAENNLINEVGSTLSDKLADGEYFVNLLPESTGYIKFGYMTVLDGDIISLYFDHTIDNETYSTTLFSSNKSTSNNGLSINEQIVLLMNTIIDNQSTLVNTIIDSYNYTSEETLTSINDLEIFQNDDFKTPIDDYIDIFEMLVREAADEKLVQDANLINEELLNNERYFNNSYFIIDTTEVEYLPLSISNLETSNYYTLKWSSENTKIVDLDINDNGYDVVIDDDIEEDEFITLKLQVFLENTYKIVDTFYYEVPLLTRRDEGIRILNNPEFDLPAAFLLENHTFEFPTSDKVQVKWISSDASVFEDGVTRNINSNKELILTAFVDLNEDGLLDNGEPTKQFNVMVLTEENAIEKVHSAIGLSNIYKYLDKDFRLSKYSPVWGIDYTWVTYNDYVTLTEYEDYVDVSIIRKDYDSNVSFIADLNFGSSVNDYKFNYKILAGSKNAYAEYVEEDASALEFCNLKSYDVSDPKIVPLDLTKLTKDDLIGVISDGECKSIVVDKLNEYNVGIARGSKIKFEVNDFGMFVDNNGLILYEDYEKDAYFTLTATIEYTGGLVKSTLVKEWDLVILSSNTQEENAIEDESELVDYLIDISHNQGRDVEIDLPVTGYINSSTITWTLNESISTIPNTMYDVSKLADGEVIILTNSGLDSLAENQRLVLTATSTYGNYSTSKVIIIRLKD
ncbi:hypothetical protein RI065_03900 [Mycoplasmatota bacterium zrk1]